VKDELREIPLEDIYWPDDTDISRRIKSEIWLSA